MNNPRQARNELCLKICIGSLFESRVTSGIAFGLKVGVIALSTYLLIRLFKILLGPQHSYYSHEQYIIGISSAVVCLIGFENFIILFVAVRYK